MQALLSDPLAHFYSKRPIPFSVDMMRCIAKANPESPIFWGLIFEPENVQNSMKLHDRFIAVSIVSYYPSNAVGPLGSFLKLITTASVKKWKSLLSSLVSLENARNAFLQAHGPYLMIHAITDIRRNCPDWLALQAASPQDPSGGNTQNLLKCTSPAALLLERINEHGKNNKKIVYVEARKDQRTWLKAHNFKDIMVFQGPGGRGPSIHMMMIA